jgi:hypothetical protein
MKRRNNSFVKPLIAAVMFFVSASALFAQGQVTMIEADRTTSQNDSSIFSPVLPSTPISGALSGSSALVQSGQLPSASLSIQAVPEPSTLALGSLAFGLLAIFPRTRKKCLSF